MHRTRLGIQSCWRLQYYYSQNLQWEKEIREERGGWCGEVGESFHNSCSESEEGEWGEVKWMKMKRMRMKSEKHGD